MPVVITPASARLLTTEDRQAAMERMGLPRLIAKLAALMTPDPMMPAFGSLKLLDLPARRAALLAQARMAKVLADLGFPDPGRLWRFLERHPRLVTAQSVSRLPKPPRAQGLALGQTQFPRTLEEPIAVSITRGAPNRGEILAHELATAATGLAKRESEALPGLVPSYVGTVKFSQHYPTGNWGPEYLPTLFDRPDWIHMVDKPRVFRALDEWFPDLPMPPAPPGAFGLHMPGGP